jgi:transcriptional regulator with XRE-family HTH domain
MSVRAFYRAMKEREVPGSSYPTIHRYLSDRTEPSMEFLEAAAEALEVRLPWLSSGEGGSTEEEERQRLEKRFTAKGLRMEPRFQDVKALWLEDLGPDLMDGLHRLASRSRRPDEDLELARIRVISWILTPFPNADRLSFASPLLQAYVRAALAAFAIAVDAAAELEKEV